MMEGVIDHGTAYDIHDLPLDIAGLPADIFGDLTEPPVDSPVHKQI